MVEIAPTLGTAPESATADSACPALPPEGAVPCSGRPVAAADANFGLGFGVAIPFVNHLGFELKLFEGGLSETAYAPKPEHLNSFAVTHGGALMTLLDVTMAAASRSVQSDMGVVTIEMKTTFMQPARGKLSGKGRLMHRTATMAFAEATVFDEDGRACAHSTGTFKYVRRLPTGPKSSNPLNVISTD